MRPLGKSRLHSSAADANYFSIK